MKTTIKFKTPLWKKILDRIAKYFHYSKYSYISECIQDLYEQYGLGYPWFNGIKLSMVKKVFPEMFSKKKMIKIQPMERPSGIFFNFIYEECKAEELGTKGHDFLKGFFILNDKQERVYLREDPKEFKKLYLKYGHIKDKS